MVHSTPMLLGHYRPLDSYLHKLDTRSKLVPVLGVMVLGLLTESLLFYLITLSGLMVGLAFSGITLSTLGQNLKPIMVLAAITFVYHIIFSGRDSDPIFELFGLALTEGGLSKAAYFSARLLLFVSIVFLVTLTSSPSELAEAVAKLFRPLRRIGLPADDLGLILFIAIRFIPVLHEEFLAIRNAQAIRGVDFSGSFVSRIRKAAAIVVPVLISAINRADELALAMESRGYRSGGQRTFYSKKMFDSQAWVFAIGSTLALVAAYYATGR